MGGLPQGTWCAQWEVGCCRGYSALMVTSASPVTYQWYGGARPPAGMRVSQVYGYLFDDKGRVVVLRDGAAWNLPGGTPEPRDADEVATLVREVREEVQVEIAEPVYLGYQEVRRRGQEPYAQLRMAARATEFCPRAMDPDKERIHVRHRCSVPEALALLNWGSAAQEQAKAATRVAEARWQLPVGDPVTPYTD